MIVTVFDTETTELVNYKLPHNSPAQPHLMQLAMIMIDTKTWLPLKELSVLVATDNEPGVKAFEAHGISREKALEFGIQPKTAAAFVRHFAVRSDRMVAHNKQFDIKMLQIEQARHDGNPAIFDGKDMVCTMLAAKNAAKIPMTAKQIAAGFTGYKNPNLTECMMAFFGETLDGAHDAMIDTRGCLRVYRHLVELGEIKE